MIVRSIRNEEKALFNSVVNHPMQSWEWGEFKLQNGQQVERIGFFDNGKLSQGLQISFHDIPVIHRLAGYCPKGFAPSDDQLGALTQIGQKIGAVFIKLEPNVLFNISDQDLPVPPETEELLKKHNARAGRRLFSRHTFELDLTPSEEPLFANLDSKTRYNVNLAKRKGVVVYENSTDQGLENHLHILKDTTNRQGFYAHDDSYFRTMWQTLKNSGMIRIFEAHYENEILVSWIMFVFNGVLYYPYGASLRIHRNVMASNLMMWEMIRFGKSLNCHLFDMWGALGPNADEKNSWFGFHKFKKGYGSQLKQSLGTFDVVVDKQVYPIFRIAEDLRWKILRFKKSLPF